MIYQYKDQKPKLFTESGQEMFLAIRDHVGRCLATAGAVRMREATSAADSGCGYLMLACVDRMVELGELAEVSDPDTIDDHRVFTRPYGDPDAFGDDF